MPFSGPGDESLPQNVKDLPEGKRAQWVAVFNSAYKKCSDEGGDKEKCEPSAFAQAWGVVNKAEESIRNIFADAIDKVISLFRKKGEPIPDIFAQFQKNAPERAKSISTVADAVFMKIDEINPNAWLTDIYADDGGALFAIVAADGKLYQIDITMENGEVNVSSDWKEVEMEFQPAGTADATEPEPAPADGGTAPTPAPAEAEPMPVAMSKFRAFTQVIRQSDGKFRFISISCSAVLNRCGEIDSRELFDNFVKHATEENIYPIRQFFHAGPEFRTGQVDFMGRDGYLLILSGLYDDSDLARMEIEARTKEPEYWGDSIGFLPYAEPDVLKVNESISIPVYRDGFCYEVSTLPENQAAAWMTAMPTLQEVKRMLNNAQMQAFTKLFGNDEDAAKKWLEENAATRNRAIEENGMITRSDTTQVSVKITPQPDGSADTTVSTTPAEQAATPPADTPPADNPPADTPPADGQTVEIDDKTMTAITTLVMEQLKPTLDDIDARLKVLEGGAAPAAKQSKEFADRLTLLEKSDEEKRALWLADLPKRSTLKVSYRPRSTSPAEEITAEMPVNDTEAQVAEVLARIPAKY